MNKLIFKRFLKTERDSAALVGLGGSFYLDWDCFVCKDGRLGRVEGTSRNASLNDRIKVVRCRFRYHSFCFNFCKSSEVTW